MEISFVYADTEGEFNTSRWLCVQVAEALVRTGKSSTNLIPIQLFDANTTEVQEVCKRSDIIIVERNLRWNTLSNVLNYRSMNKLMVATFDDGYHLMHPDNPAYPYWIGGKTVGKNNKNEDIIIDAVPNPLKLFKLGLSVFHGLYTPSKTLTKDFKDCNPVAMYSPHYFETEKYTKIKKEDVVKYKSNKIIIGWGGSASHMKSFYDAGLIKALQRIFRNRKDLMFLICGDKRVYDLFPLEESQKMFFSYRPYEKWPESLVHFDIGLAPSAGEYDQRRSWIKPMEYSLMKIPWLASDGLAYQDIRKYGKLVKNDSKSWEEALYLMIDNLEKERQFTADVAFPFAMSQDIDKNMDNYLKVFKEIALKNGFRVED